MKFFKGEKGIWKRRNQKTGLWYPILERKEEYLIENHQGSRFLETFVT